MTNKILLAAIALGLWANAAVSYVRPAHAQSDQQLLTGIYNDVHNLVLGGPGCTNRKLCN